MFLSQQFQLSDLTHWSCFLSRVKGVALISFFCGQIVSFSSTMIEQASIPMPVFDDFVRNLGFISGSTITYWSTSVFVLAHDFVTVVLDWYLKTDIMVLPEVFLLLGIALARL